MSRLHRQKLRLRSQQRADELIEPTAREIDRDAFQEVGTTHAGARQALELVKRHTAPDPASLRIERKADPRMAHFLESLSPAELEELRAQIARKHAQGEQASGQAGAAGAQNPPM